MIRIILLDVDGVLVYPGGYRAALRATVEHFTWPQLEVKEGLLTDLERRGISSEWDMAPLLIAAHWETVLSRRPLEDLPADVAQAALEIRRHGPDGVSLPSIPEFPLLPGLYPAESALRSGCFASIPYGLRQNLLTETRNVRASHTMRIFQHFTLGTAKFIDTYHLPAELQTDSFLHTHDRPLIDGEIRARLCRPGHHLAAFTSRPSGLPRGAEGSSFGFAPEAELALELAGLAEIPILAFGGIEHLAAQHGLDPAALVKPAPFHALAAVLAAWTGREWPALQAAQRWLETGKLDGPFHDLPPSFELIVVEDTPGGIRSARAAGETLRSGGLDVSVRALGLTGGNEARTRAFEAAGVPCFPDWKSLIETIG